MDTNWMLGTGFPAETNSSLQEKNPINTIVAIILKYNLLNIIT
jgi:hypothetical protein